MPPRPAHRWRRGEALGVVVCGLDLATRITKNALCALWVGPTVRRALVLVGAVSLDRRPRGVPGPFPSPPLSPHPTVRELFGSLAR